MPKIVIENKAFTLTELEPNLFHWHFNAVELQLKDYMVVYNMGLESFKETGHKSNIVTTHDLTFSFASDTWNFVVDRNSDFSFINAQAVVVKQLHLRVLARIVKTIRKKSYNYKVFPTYEEALTWVKSQM